MNEYVITASSCTDLPRDYCKRRNLKLLHFSFLMNGAEYKDDFGASMPLPVFYERVRGGQMPTTSMVNAAAFEECFTHFLEEGKDVLHIEFSSALSGSYGNAVAVAERLNAKYENKVTVIDSLCASLGYGLLLHYALNLRDEGKSLEEVRDWVEANKKKLIHWFTINDLSHLKRGGRLSGTAAFFGTMLKIMPVLDVDNLGRLIPCFKVRGRKHALLEMVERMKLDIDKPDGQTVFISHGDCIDDVNFLIEAIHEAFPTLGEIMVNYVGPVIGAHSGPGTVALFYIGKQRY